MDEESHLPEKISSLVGKTSHAREGKQNYMAGELE
jgi:hypothetical protein